jgi:hypothetical protein
MLVLATASVIVVQPSVVDWYRLGIGYVYFAPILFAAIALGPRWAFGTALVATATPSGTA